MTVTQWWAVIIPSGKIFMGLIFVVEGTHENFNTMKISAYTVCVGWGIYRCCDYLCCFVTAVTDDARVSHTGFCLLRDPAIQPLQTQMNSLVILFLVVDTCSCSNVRTVYTCMSKTPL